MKKFKFAAGHEVRFTADTHFGHANIIRFCDRPYRDVYHMDETLVENWNRAVPPGTTVFHLGDFGFKGSQSKLITLCGRLNGRIILIRGNHDHEKTLGMFSEVHDLAEVTVAGQTIVMCHYALQVWRNSFRGAWHIHGHSHGTLTPNWDRKICDIGVDSWDYAPVRFNQLQAEMAQHGVETVNDLNAGFITTYGKDADLLKPDDSA